MTMIVIQSNLKADEKDDLGSGLDLTSSFFVAAFKLD